MFRRILKRVNFFKIKSASYGLLKYELYFSEHRLSGRFVTRRFTTVADRHLTD